MRLDAAVFTVVGLQLLASSAVAQQTTTRTVESPTAISPADAPTSPAESALSPPSATRTTGLPRTDTADSPTLIVTALSTLTWTLSQAAFIGYTALSTSPGLPVYAPYYCPSPATYTTSSEYAACCEGPCVVPTRCVEYYHTDVPTTRDPAQVTCVYTEFRQTREAWASCRTTGIAPYPTRGVHTELAMLIGCDVAASAVEGDRYLYRATVRPSSGMAKSEVIAIGILVPSIVITLVGAAACYWRYRMKAQRRKAMLPAYEDCLRESRPPAYSPTPESSPDVNPPPRVRSPPPDYAASMENLPARFPRDTADWAGGRAEAEADPSSESHEMQNLDRSAVESRGEARGSTENAMARS